MHNIAGGKKLAGDKFVFKWKKNKKEKLKGVER